MGIVFYSHRVNYPMALSAQVIPNFLKTIVINNLEQMKHKVLGYSLVKEYDIIKQVTLQQIQDNINFLEAKDMHPTHWQDCVNFNRALDKTRNQDFLTVNPEFAPYV